MRNTTHCTVLLAILLLAGCESTHQRIATSDLPREVVAGFDSEYPGAAIQRVRKETYKDGQVHYEIEFKTRAGKSLGREFTPEGQLLPEH